MHRRLHSRDTASTSLSPQLTPLTQEDAPSTSTTSDCRSTSPLSFECQERLQFCNAEEAGKTQGRATCISDKRYSKAARFERFKSKSLYAIGATALLALLLLLIQFWWRSEGSDPWPAALKDELKARHFRSVYSGWFF